MTVQCILAFVPMGECFLYGDELFVVLDPDGSEVGTPQDQGGVPDIFVCSIDGAEVGFIPASTIVTPVNVGFFIGYFGED